MRLPGDKKKNQVLRARQQARTTSDKKLTKAQNESYVKRTGGKAARIGPGSGRGTSTGG